MRKISWLQQTVILFWALWFSFVTASDAVNWLQKVKLIPLTFNFTSNNYDLVVKMLSTYQLHYHALALGLFLLLVLSALVIALTFWMTFISRSLKLAYLSFGLSFLMTAVFILTDELFIQYEFEHQHIIRLAFQILTFLLFCKIDRLRANNS